MSAVCVCQEPPRVIHTQTEELVRCGDCGGMISIEQCERWGWEVPRKTNTKTRVEALAVTEGDKAALETARTFGRNIGKFMHICTHGTRQDAEDAGVELGELFAIFAMEKDD